MARITGRRLFDSRSGTCRFYFKSNDVKPAGDGGYLIGGIFYYPKEIVGPRVSADGFQLNPNYYVLEYLECDEGGNEFCMVKRKIPHETEGAEFPIPKGILKKVIVYLDTSL